MMNLDAMITVLDHLKDGYVVRHVYLSVEMDDEYLLRYAMLESQKDVETIALVLNMDTDA